MKTQNKRKVLSVLIPLYNEEKTLSKLVQTVKKVDLSSLGVDKEIVIVDDCSADNSLEIAKKIPDVKVIAHKKNMGKGAAIRTAIKYATGDIIIIQDADLEYDPNDYKALITPILEGKTKVVYGSRFLRKHKAKYKAYYLGNKLLSLLTSILYFRKISDMETCYKVFRSDVIKNIKLRAKRFDLEPEITSKLLKKGYKIIEVPIWYKCRDFKEGKKITWKDGIKAIWYLVKYRFID